MRNLLAVALVLVAGVANAATITDKIDRTLDVKPGSELNLSNVNGRVTVKSWDQPRVRIVAEKRTEAGDPEAARDAMKLLKVDIIQRNNVITVETKHPRKNGWGFLDFITGQDVEIEVMYELWVPRNVNLEIGNVNGAVNASDVSGKLEFSTVNGKIDLSRCSGSLEASTVNGSIRAELLKVTKGQPVRLSTTNGRITVYVPSTLAATLDADTTNGSIDSDIPVAVSSKSRNSLRGTINGGGPELNLSTTNGGIDIKTTK
jgi:DUF4097 and DUF4098 domain-containing protein YvlB